MFVHKNVDLVYLSDVSPRDQRWDSLKIETGRRADFFADAEADRYAERLTECARLLEFATDVKDTGEVILFLRSAYFCRVRLCAVCQWRRSVMWLAKTSAALPKILDEYPKAQFIYLTLTAKNCPVTELRSQLSKMNRAWSNLTKRSNFPAIGWLRVTEVTRDANDYAHPHFHALLMVRPSYFGHGYISQQAWTELWQSCLTVDYTPIIDVRRVKPREYAHSSNAVTQDNIDATSCPNELCQDKAGQYAHSPSHPNQGLIDAVKYTLKYGTKDVGLTSPKKNRKRSEQTMRMSDKEWFLLLAKQLHKTRAIATGGVIKKYLKQVDVEYQDLIHSEEHLASSVRTGDEVLASWREKAERYALIN